MFAYHSVRSSMVLVLGLCWISLNPHHAAAQSLPAPVATEPANGARLIGPYPHFSWQAVPGAQQYRWQMARDERFQSVVGEDTVHAVVRWYVHAAGLSEGAYWWRVRAQRDDGAVGPWSAARSLHVVPAARQFSITPDTPLAEVRRVAEQAAAGPSACLRLAPGQYRWDPGYEGAVFRWQNATDIVVDAAGADIHLLDPSAQAFQLRGCQRLVIRGMRLHHQPTPYAALEVLSVAPDGAWLDARVQAGFAEGRYPRKVNQFFLYAVDPNDFRQKHPSRPGHTYLADNTESLGDGRFRYYPRDDREKGSLRQLRAGDRALACYRRWPLNWMTGCRDVAWVGIVGGCSEGALFMGGDNQDIKFLGLVSRRYDKYFPTAGGWVTGNDRRGPWIEGCTWEGMTDDGPNITGNSFLIDAAPAADEFILSTGPGWQTSAWRAGDEVIFWNPLTGLPLTTTRVVAAATVTEAGPWRGKLRVRVAESPASVNPGRDLHRHTHVYNLSTQNQQLVVRRNTLVGGRRFGFNIKAIGALIEQNRFEGQASSAIYLENEPSGWEGLVNRQVVVQDNTIVGCGFDAFSRRVARACIHVNTWRNNPVMAETEWIGNRELIIRRNTILDCAGIAISVDNAEEVRIAENRIERRPGATGQAIEVLDRTRRIEQRDNLVTEVPQRKEP